MAEVEEVISSVAASLGSLDVLVNNAGVNTLHDRVTIDRFPRSEWDRLLAVDLTGLYDVSRFVPEYAKTAFGAYHQHRFNRGVGPIAAPVRVCGREGRGRQPHQGNGLGARTEWNPRQWHRTRVTLTDGTRQLFYSEGGLFHDSVKQMIAHIPLGRPAESREIAVAALFLADPDNSYMNGHILTVDGGWTAGYAREF